MKESTAKLLARATAGAPVNEAAGTSGKGGKARNVNMVMAALGMGKASAPGAQILLANYCEDQVALKLAQAYLVRWAWLAWLQNEPSDTPVTTRQINDLVKMALHHHTNPGPGRSAGIKKMAAAINVNHQTFRKKYKAHYQRIAAEISYLEGQAAARLEKALGK